MRTFRHWPVRLAGTVEHLYGRFGSLMTACALVFRTLGFARAGCKPGPAASGNRAFAVAI